MAPIFYIAAGIVFGLIVSEVLRYAMLMWAHSAEKAALRDEQREQWERDHPWAARARWLGILVALSGVVMVFSPDDAAHGYGIAVITVGVVLLLLARLPGLHR
jgi:hypothetical protein